MNTPAKKKPYDEAMKKIIEADVNNLYHDFEKTTIFNTERQLPLHIFEENFLELFKGNIKDEELRKEKMDLWARVAGTVYRPVDIVDPSTSEVLFTIPSMYNGNLIDLKKAEALEFALRQYHSHYQRSPKMAEDYLITNTDKIINHITVENIESAKLEQWRSFATYYKLTPESRDVSQQETIDDDSIDFDF